MHALSRGTSAPVKPAILIRESRVHIVRLAVYPAASSARREGRRAWWTIISRDIHLSSSDISRCDGTGSSLKVAGKWLNMNKELSRQIYIMILKHDIPRLRYNPKMFSGVNDLGIPAYRVRWEFRQRIWFYAIYTRNFDYENTIFVHVTIRVFPI